MTYGIWLSWNNQQEGFQLPVNPASIEISDGNKGQTYDVAELGEINVIKNPKLTTYQFSSIFPSPTARRYYAGNKFVDPLASGPIVSFVNFADVTPQVRVKTNPYVEYLTRWMESKRPIRFVFTGETFDINEAVSIEAFDWKEIAGSSGDIEFTLTLKKYVFYAAQHITVNQASGTQQIVKVAASRPDDRQPPKAYTMRAGDTLWKVAQTQLGDGARWREIQKINGITDAQIKALSVGKVLNLPA